MGGRKIGDLAKKCCHFAHLPLYELSTTFVGGSEVGVSRAFEGSYSFFETIQYELREKCVFSWFSIGGSDFLNFEFTMYQEAEKQEGHTKENQFALPGHCNSILSHVNSAHCFERLKMTLCCISSGLLGRPCGGVEKVRKTLMRYVCGL